jgi:secretion/DNA translocation related TadE-like protein
MASASARVTRRTIESARGSVNAGSDDRGSGTVWTVALIGAVWTVAAMAMAVGGARAARHRAHAAADLAALAAAAHVAEGAERACLLAARVARDSQARLHECAVHGAVADVIVTSQVRSLPRLGRLTATARARAGPVDGGGLPKSDPPGTGVTGGGLAR